MRKKGADINERKRKHWQTFKDLNAQIDVCLCVLILNEEKR